MARNDDRSRRLALAFAVLWLAHQFSGCASPPAAPLARADRTAIVRIATAQIGRPYVYGGSSPSGFDCSGLVIYSYRKAGLPGLPHSAAALAERSHPIPLSGLRPGDLLFFQRTSAKPHHVGIYIGGREFVHAPSGGKRVEKVGFDHVYWGGRIKRAGRLVY